MLMKMFRYKSVMSTVSIGLGCILLAILVAYACDLDALRKANDKAATAYRDAQQARLDHEAAFMDYLLWYGGIAGGTVGWGKYVSTSSFIAAAKVVPGVAAIGSLAGTCWWTKRMIDLVADEDEKRAVWVEARADYEACAYPPALFQFTDENGHTYEFADRESYDQFRRNRGITW